MAAAASQAKGKALCDTDLDKARVPDPDGHAASPSIKRKPKFGSRAHGAAILVNKPGAAPRRIPGPGSPRGPMRAPPGRGSAALPSAIPARPRRRSSPPPTPAQPATTKAEGRRALSPLPRAAPPGPAPRRPLTVLREDVEAALGRAPGRLPAAARRPARAAPSRSPRRLLLLLLGRRLLLEPGARLPDAAHLLPHRRAAGRGPPLTCRRCPARRAASRSSPVRGPAAPARPRRPRGAPAWRSRTLPLSPRRHLIPQSAGRGDRAAPAAASGPPVEAAPSPPAPSQARGRCRRRAGGRGPVRPGRALWSAFFVSS